MTAVPPNPTLEDVARMAGVSTATVSRCLNAPDKVVERTRVRVLEAVRVYTAFVNRLAGAPSWFLPCNGSGGWRVTFCPNLIPWCW